MWQKNAIAELDRLSEYFPDGVHYTVVLNATDYVRESIDDVVSTFVITSLIVMVVILLFLQNWRAVIIPMLTIPVSLIATFAVMKLLGFSLNTLTLFGLVLAIAIVVDDAIVVVEDCSRIVDKGIMTRREAAEKAMRELQGPVVERGACASVGVHPHGVCEWNHRRTLQTVCIDHSGFYSVFRD